ncbi:unnamed protein product [Clavelina lepadiformis]|uniref:Uncharacterized protein n=1 Tax=Clavelina lepadiformis TaxID=159417 RepID=A0ABP0GJL4_CLALP
MECHPVGIQVDVLLKTISDMISQQFKSMRQDMRKEFVKMQESMEDVISTLLAEINKTETVNNAMSVEETSQTTVLKSDISLNIEDVYSEKAPVFPLVEAIKEEPLLLEEYEVSQTEIDDPNISMLNKIPPQSYIGVNATVKIVKPQSRVARNVDEEFSDSVEMNLNKSTAVQGTNACKMEETKETETMNNAMSHQRNITSISVRSQTMEFHPVGMQVDLLLKAISDMVSQEFKSMRQDMRKDFVKMQESMEDVILTLLPETKKTETMNNAMPVEETSQTTVVKSDISLNIEEVYSEKAPVFPLVEVIKQEPLLLEEYEVSHRCDVVQNATDKTRSEQRKPCFLVRWCDVVITWFLLYLCEEHRKPCYRLHLYRMCHSILNHYSSLISTHQCVTQMNCH